MVENTNIDPNNWKRFEDWQKKKKDRKEKKRIDRAELRKKWGTLSEARLYDTLEKEITGHDWLLDSHPEGMDGAQRVDVLGEPQSQNRLVFIELERGRSHPIDNVVKAWRYIEDNANSKPILLVQIFSPFFYAKTDNRRRMNEAVFIGKQAEKVTNKLKYEQLGQEYWPPAEDSKLDTIIDRISALIAYDGNK